jgi:hypothetical protein
MTIQTKPWWHLVYYRPDGTDGETEDLWTERSAMNTYAMARAAGHHVRLEYWTPSCAVISDVPPEPEPSPPLPDPGSDVSTPPSPHPGPTSDGAPSWIERRA